MPVDYAALDLVFLHARAASLRWSVPTQFFTRSLIKRRVFDLGAIVACLKSKFYYTAAVKVFGNRKVIAPYLPEVESLGLKLIELPDGPYDRAAAEMAIAYDVAAHVFESYYRPGVAIGADPTRLQHIVKRLRSAGKQGLFVDLESEPRGHGCQSGQSDLLLLDHWRWCQPRQLSLDPQDLSPSIDELDFSNLTIHK